MGSTKLWRNNHCAPGWPDWLPAPMRLYLAHTVGGRGIRALARAEGRHPSTVLRQIRRIESLRDDPLADAALSRLSHRIPPGSGTDAGFLPKESRQDMLPMTATKEDDSVNARDTLRVLSALMEPRSLMVVADGVEDAVVVHDNGDGRPQRRAVLGRALAESLVLRELISGAQKGRLARYTITAAGRVEANRLMAEAESRRAALLGSAENPEVIDAGALFAPQGARGTVATSRSAGTEAPYLVLARRRRADGEPWLPAELVTVAHRFRETWEIARIGGAITRDWERLVVGQVTTSKPSGDHAPTRRLEAEQSLAAAIRSLGPDLAETVLLGVCQERGMEEIEQRLDFPARSGKIVLRIALRSLARHYEHVGSAGFDMIS